MIVTGNRSLAKSDRLLSASDFSRLRTGSRVQKFSHCMVISQSNSSDHARLGIAVSKRTGNAVRRNLLKRVIREQFRHWDSRRLALDIMVIPSGAVKSLNDEQAVMFIRDNLSKAFLKLSS